MHCTYICVPFQRQIMSHSQKLTNKTIKITPFWKMKKTNQQTKKNNNNKKNPTKTDKKKVDAVISQGICLTFTAAAMLSPLEAPTKKPSS